MNTNAVDTSIVKHEIPNPRDKDQKKEFYTIEPSSHPDFPIDFAIASITTKEIADLINSFFKPALTDYAGCRSGVVVGPGRVYYADSVAGPEVINTAISKLGLKPGTYFVELCFRDNDPGREGTIKTLKATNFVAKNEDTSVDPDNLASNLCSRIMVQNRMSSIARTGNSYEIDKKTTQVLEAFRFKYANPVRWADLKIETLESINTATSRSEIIVGISGLDMHAIISTIYGTKDPDADDSMNRNRKYNKYEYNMYPINASYNSFVNGKCIFHIVRMDTDVLSRVRSDMGLHTINNIRFYNC